ncbi:lin-10 [Danaus plexippus plexippus]|uniref:Lin-10 n=1 Tax=Danaus plexippus plexippus TaxID=278856 RepID=A0A212FG43_DANPL|nr:lin-10 [Danaus plexippus plexippus]
MQHQHDRLSTGLEGRDMISVNNASSDEEQDQVILNTKGGTYKLRDSRIIEIAGGRELYSQSRAKAVRKLRHSTTHKHNLRNKVRSLNKDAVDYTNDNNINNEITIHRINSEPKKMISRHTSPVTYTNGDREATIEQNPMGIPKNSSPILDPHKINDVSTKSSPIAVVADGEVMVFDENDDWKGLRMDPDASDHEIDLSVKRTLDNMKNGDCDMLNNKSELSCDESESSRSEDVRLSEGSPTAVWLSGDEDKNRVTRVIGELPIAEYEGSPRRYGIGSQKAPVRSPRPGFPQRVLPESRDATPPPGSAAFDYLYEFSETRKVLEEFFRCPTLPGQQQNINDEIVNFQELDYELRRQTQDCPSENGIDGSESDWPQNEPIESPHALNNHTDFLGLQQKRGRFPSPEISALQPGDGASVCGSPPGSSSRSDLSVAGAESEMPVKACVRYPAMFPANESEIQLSMAIIETDLAEMQVQEGLRTLPIVEDGLSSGHTSDADNNNAILQTHSATIEEQVDSVNNTDLVLTDADLHSLDPLAMDVCMGKRPSSAQSTESVEIKPASGDEDEADTDLETDRLLGQQRTDDQGFFDDKVEVHREDDDDSDRKDDNDVLGLNVNENDTSDQGSCFLSVETEYKTKFNSNDEISKAGCKENVRDTITVEGSDVLSDSGWRKPKSRTVMPSGGSRDAHDDHREDEVHNGKDKDGKKKSKNKEDWAAVLIEGVLFRARYLGSTQLACEGQPTKATRMLQAEEAVSRIKWGCEGPYSGVYAAPAAVFRLSFLGSVEVDEDSRRRKRRPKKNMVEEAVTKIKAPEGENQPSTEVDLFISTEKIMVLNTELKEIMMDHALRTISYIADIGDLVVLMARRRFVPHENDSDQPKLNRTPKMICHVFESEEAQFIAQSIGQAFQVAYMEFLKANGIEDHSFVKEMDYQEELQKEVVVPKTKGEILGVVVVESGWGSMLPTVVIANLAPAGAAARCGQLNIGDQIIAINGVSLVGLPLSTCQTYIKNSKNQTVVKLTVVPCAPVVEVKIKRPDTKYQLGFSVQNGVICSLLRGGIAERGGVRVGHRIIEINSQSVVAVPHERIVNLLATSVGEILMKTMPTSMFRLLTGQENPVFI